MTRVILTAWYHLRYKYIRFCSAEELEISSCFWCKIRIVPARQRKLSKQIMESVYEINDRLSKEDNIESELNWYESEPKIDALSDSNYKTDKRLQNLKAMMVLLVKKFDEIISICNDLNQRMQEKHKGEILPPAHQVQKVRDLR